MSLRDHARLAPSSAYTWADPDGCPGSVEMQERYPEIEDSPKAREGTAAHHYATETILGRPVALGALAPNGEPINQEMIDCAQEWIRDVTDTYGANCNAALRVEHRVTMAIVHAQCWGTPDAYMIDMAARKIWLWDYKYGHRFVDAFRNWQLLLYLIGILEKEGVPVEEWHLWTFAATISQPRQYSSKPQEWYGGGKFLVEILPHLQRAAIAATMPNAILKTGEHCLHCSAVTRCAAMTIAKGAALDVALWAQPHDPTPHQVSLELRIIERAESMLKARKMGLEELGLHMMRQGLDLPLHKGEHSRGRETWTVDTATVITTGQVFGVDLRKPDAPLTPKQAVKAGLPEQAAKAMSEIPSGAIRLVPYDGDDVVRAFSAQI